jgi:folate-binding protein YgfZ
MAVVSPGQVAQDEALRRGCALIDRSERGRLALDGPEARNALNGLISNDVSSLSAGTGQLATFLTPKGKMLGVLRVLDSGEQLLLDTDRVSLQALFDLLRQGLLGHAAQLHKRTLQTAQLSLLGPKTGELLAACLGAGALPPSGGHNHSVASIDGISVRVINTAEGADLLCAAQAGQRVSQALLAAGAVAVTEAAADILRVEAGRPQYGVDMDDGTMPEEAGLVEQTVSFSKGCYVGQETVARLHWRGRPNRHLRGLRLAAPVEPGTVLRLDGRDVGKLSSCVSSPAYGEIGLALVRREAAYGVSLDAGGVPALVTELPFSRPVH